MKASHQWTGGSLRTHLPISKVLPDSLTLSKTLNLPSDLRGKASMAPRISRLEWDPKTHIFPSCHVTHFLQCYQEGVEKLDVQTAPPNKHTPPRCQSEMPRLKALELIQYGTLRKALVHSGCSLLPLAQTAPHSPPSAFAFYRD